MAHDTRQTLQLHPVAIDTYRENVAYLHRDCQLYRTQGFQALSKVEIRGTNGGRSLLAVLNIVDDSCITTPGQLGLSQDAFRLLGQPEGTPVTVHPSLREYS